MKARKLTFLLFMLTCCAIFCTLGTWQVKRLAWKQDLINSLDQAYEQSGPVSIDDIRALPKDRFLYGSFKGYADFSKAFALSGQIDNGQQTSHLMVPFTLKQNDTVLIDLGPDFKATPTSGTVDITGLMRHAPQPNAFTLPNSPETNTWFSIDAAALGLKDLKPLVIKPEATPWRHFERHKPELRNSHLQYAIFWFTTAFVIAALTVYYLRRA